MTFVKLKELKEHKQFVHRIKRTPNEPAPEYQMNKELGKYACLSCNVTTVSESEIEEHVKIHKELICEHCNARLVDPYKYSCHINKHLKNGYACPFCDFVTMRSTSINAHINLTHLKKYRYTCRYCGKGFADCKFYQEHERQHIGAEKFVCVVCNKDYSFSSYLHNHQVRYHTVNIEGVILSNQCEICLKVFSKMSIKDRHMKKHDKNKTAPKKHLCDNCGKVFTCAYKLKLHYRSHTGYKPHTCTYCQKTFSKPECLKIHERIHTGEKPYSCDICGKCFNQSTPLRVHIRGHTGERPYLCKCCNKGFISKGALTIHMKSCSFVDSSDSD